VHTSQWQPTPPPPPRAPMWIAGAVFVALLAGTGVVGWLWWESRNAFVDLAGRVVITDNDPTVARFTWSEKGWCNGTDDYGDVVEGGPVTIRDGEGETLAVVQLTRGKPGGIEDTFDGYQRATTCTLTFRADTVPERDFYAIQVGQQPPVTVAAGTELLVPFGG